MSMQDPIADMLTRVRNAQGRLKTDVSMPSSKLKAAICVVLQDEGYIQGFEVSTDAKPTLTVQLKYHEGKPVIEEIGRASRPGLRSYRRERRAEGARWPRCGHREHEQGCHVRPRGS